MFRRRKQQPVHYRVGNLFWPRIGWGRASRYMWHRVLRLHGTPYSIAAGIACGAAVSLTPMVGGHFVLGALLAWAIGGNIVAALIGTAVGNPWTFPFIWLWTYKLGSGMLGGPTVAKGIGKPNFAQVFADLIEALLRFDFGADFLHKFWAVWWPMMVGSLPSAVVVWLAVYVMVQPVIATYQHQRIMRRRRRRKALNEATVRRARQAPAMAGLPKVEEEAKS